MVLVGWSAGTVLVAGSVGTLPVLQTGMCVGGAGVVLVATSDRKTWVSAASIAASAAAIETEKQTHVRGNTDDRLICHTESGSARLTDTE